MAYKVLGTAGADRDRDRIAAYLSQQLNNTWAAARFLQNIHEQALFLCDTPAMFPLLREGDFAERGYRRMPIPGCDYFAVYRIDETSKTVYVLRVFYNRQDYPTLLTEAE